MTGSFLFAAAEGAGWLEKLLPGVMNNPTRFYNAIRDTLLMVAWSGALMLILGMLLGVALTVTAKGGILQNRVVHEILDKLINILRSIPFVLLIVLLFDVSGAIMGTSSGVKGAIIPLVVGSAPFFARQVESALAGIGGGVVEAAKSMGCSPLSIIFRVYLKEGAAAIARGATITVINLIGLTAMAGWVGAGGLGDYAVTWGHNYGKDDIVYVSVLAIIVIVCVVQLIGSLIAKKNTH